MPFPPGGQAPPGFLSPAQALAASFAAGEEPLPQATGLDGLVGLVVCQKSNVKSLCSRKHGESPNMSKMPLPDCPPRPPDAPTALDGLLVIDFTRVVAGPAYTQTLADFGANVIKIENPDGGDDTRAYEHAEIGGESAVYLSLNRNKRGVALDLAVPKAREVARELISRADVVVEDFSAGVMEKFGLDYTSVASTNPRLVYCSISAYGRQGPFASRPGFDPITQAESGR